MVWFYVDVITQSFQHSRKDLKGKSLEKLRNWETSNWSYWNEPWSSKNKHQCGILTMGRSHEIGEWVATQGF